VADVSCQMCPSFTLIFVFLQKYPQVVSCGKLKNGQIGPKLNQLKEEEKSNLKRSISSRHSL
jgi:hypothetical protein